MLTRLFVFAMMLALGGALAYGIGGARYVLSGVVVSALSAVAWDFWRAGRLLNWLKDPFDRLPPLRQGAWGEAGERIWRLLRASEKRERASDARLQDFLSAIQASPNGVVLLNPEGQIEWMNQTAASHFALDPLRDHMQHIGHLVRDPDFGSYLGAVSPGTGIVIPGPHSTPAHPVRLYVQLHAYGEGRRLLLSRDVTVVEQAEAMRRDFVANVSHEIRTPLTVLSGFVETLQNLDLDESERQRYLDLMARQAERMQALVNDLLTLSRLEGSPPPNGHEWSRAADLLASCEAEARNLARLVGHEGQTLAFEGVPDLELGGSASELFSAMSNLVNNAVRYTPASGSVRAVWRRLPDGGAEFSVTDTGPGIAAEHLPRLTERFYRVDRSRSRETGGTGLGLAIVKHVVQRHGGQLSIESAPGRGSCFTFRLPPSRVRRRPQTTGVGGSLAAA